MARESDGGAAHGRLEEPTLEEEVIVALSADNASKAARLLRQMNDAGRFLLDVLADMLDGESKSDQGRFYTDRVRLRIVAWKPGRPKKGNVLDEAPSAAEKFIAALCNRTAATAAQLLRQTESIGRDTLTALAAMLDGDTQSGPYFAGRPPYRLKIVTGASAGRPRVGDFRKVTAKPRRHRKSKMKSRGWEFMISGRVKRYLRDDPELTLHEAILKACNAQPFADPSDPKYIPPSYEAVEKAYYRRYGKCCHRTPRSDGSSDSEQ